jgi:Flp pilus assembly protein TadG
MGTTSRAATRADTRRARADPDAGMVTVEAAIALCAFVTMLAMILAGTSAVLDQIRCTDAAREAARLVARGEADLARDAVDRIAPHGATLTIDTNGDAVTAVVAADPVRGLVPGVRVRAEAYAVREPEAGDQPRSANGPPMQGQRPAEGGAR